MSCKTRTEPRQKVTKGKHRRITIRLISLMLALAAVILSLTACNKDDENNESTITTSQTTQPGESGNPPEQPGTQPGNNSQTTPSTVGGTDITVISEDDMFSKRDKRTAYDETTAVTITLSDNSTVCGSEYVTVDGNTVKITGAGTYVISGALTCGQIMIDAGDDDKIQLVFNGVDISNSSSAALYVKNADKVFVTLAEGSNNTLSVTGEYVAIDDNNIDAVVFAKDDITFNGSGSLTVNAAYGHGIVCKDDLVFTGGTYAVSAGKHALCGKDSVKITSSTMNLTSGKDGIHSENDDDDTKGYIFIASGNFTINSTGDGIDAKYYLQILDGTFNIIATEKGIKATCDLLIAGGNYTINSVDDAIHSNANINITGGVFEISTGDDGIHADANLKISAGTINIIESYEGLEGLSVDIAGGTITLNASDDGINAAGGNDSSGFQNGFGGGGRDNFGTSSNTSYISISGGKIIIDADGDGVDSNGNLYVSGGELYINGPASDGDGALDYDGEGVISGGIVVAVGSSQMAQNFGTSSTQGSILLTFSSRSSGTVNVTDSSGNTILEYTPTKSYSCIVVSAPGISVSSTYTISAAGKTQTVTMSSIIYGSGGMGGGNIPGGNQGGGMAPPERR